MTTHATPWGRADLVTMLAPGIVCVSTPSHGGIYLAPDRDGAVQADIRRLSGWYQPAADGGGWYEEDCEVAKVILQFPEIFPPRAITYAVRLFTEDGAYRLPADRLRSWLATGA